MFWIARPSRWLVPAALSLITGSPVFAAQSLSGPELGAKVAAGLPSCVQCHGARGEGQPANGFPRLAGQGKQYLAKQLRDFRSGARKNAIMAPIAKSLEERDIDAVSAYYSDIVLAQPAPTTPPQPDAEAVRAGAKLATRGKWDKDVPACFACHGPEGTGIAPNFPAIAKQNAAYTSRQLREWKSGTRDNDPQGLMKAVADRLTDSEIEAVSVYLEFLKVPVK